MRKSLRRVVPGILAGLLLACAPKEDRTGLFQKPVSRPAASGWARLPLDAEAQGAYPDLWLGDAGGVPVPYEVEREGLWRPRKLELAGLLLGRDGLGRPTAEFSLRLPEGWQVRDREHLRVDLDLQGAPPWVCRVEVDRRMPGSAFLRLERESPVHVFDLGEPGGARGFYIPWDAETYRVTLAASQGAAPRIVGVNVTASTRPEEFQADEVLSPKVEDLGLKEGRQIWRLDLGTPQRIVGADLALKPPTAPVRPHVTVPAGEAGRPKAQEAWVPSEGLVWNLPALGTKATRVSLGPVTAGRLTLSLPEGARLDAVKLLVHREVLLFPAEAGKAYFLHLGGRVKRAPGSLAALPDSSRAVFSREALRLGSGEADPHGLPVLVQGADRTRPWLAWAAGAAALLLGLFAWKLLKGAGQTTP